MDVPIWKAIPANIMLPPYRCQGEQENWNFEQKNVVREQDRDLDAPLLMRPRHRPLARRGR